MMYFFSFRAIFFLNLFWSREERRIAWRFIATRRTDPQRIGQLEKEICRLTGAKYARSVNLGRSAIQIALEAFHFQPGSEVILPSFGCTGTVVPILQAGLKPVFADVNSDLSVSIEDVQEALSEKTCAVLVPHLSGRYNRDLPAILSLARKRGIKVIDDACQSFGLKVNGRWAGTFGDVGIFSFGSGKNIFGPGGGLLATSDEAVIAHCQSRDLPRERERDVRLRVARFLWRFGCQPVSSPLQILGELFRSRTRKSRPERLEKYQFAICQISPVEAALALCQIRRYEEINSRRRTNAEFLLSSSALNRLGFYLPDPGENIFTKFLVSSESPKLNSKVRQHLLSRGIQTEGSYTPLHLRNPFSNLRRTSLTRTEKIWRGAFSIPVSPRLGSREMSRIGLALKRIEER